jgi:hypothetical protein
LYTADAGGADELYIIDTDGNNLAQVTANGARNFGAVWSPDGRQIAFSSGRDDSLDIYILSADGSGERQLTHSPYEDYAPTWSPDGRQVAFVSWRNGTADIYLVDAAGGAERNLTHSHALEINFPKWSPDGSAILFSAQGRSTLSDHDHTQGPAIASILLQSAVLVGAVLFLIRRWRLPFGALILVFTLNGLLMSVLEDRYLLALPMLGAGLVADLLLLWLKPSPAQPGRLSLFGFLVPVVFYALYFFTLQMTGGVGWTIHLWLGSIFMAGLVGLFAAGVVGARVTVSSQP